MKNLSLLTILSICVLLINCKSTKDATESKVSVKTMAIEKLGSNVDFKANEDNTMMLCFAVKESPTLAGPSVTFFVWDEGTSTIIYEGKIDRGNVSWYSNTQLAMFFTPGIMRADQTRDHFTQIYDVITKEKVMKSDLVENSNN